MKAVFYILLIAITFTSCRRERPSIGKNCEVKALPDFEYSNLGNTIIPLNTRNFWVYSDSVWDNGNFESANSTLIKIEKVYDLDGLFAVGFSTILPLLTIKDDTLFSTEITPEFSEPNCFKLHYPMFFETTDTIQVDDGLSNKFVYRSTTMVTTPTGNYADNIVFKEGKFFEVVVNKQVGIVKISFFVKNGVGLQKRRILTLKDYRLY